MPLNKEILFVAITDSPVFKNVSLANAQCVPVQAMILIEREKKKKKRKNFTKKKYLIKLNNLHPFEPVTPVVVSFSPRP